MKLFCVALVALALMGTAHAVNLRSLRAREAARMMEARIAHAAKVEMEMTVKRHMQVSLVSCHDSSAISSLLLSCH